MIVAFQWGTFLLGVLWLSAVWFFTFILIQVIQVRRPKPKRHNMIFEVEHRFIIKADGHYFKVDSVEYWPGEPGCEDDWIAHISPVKREPTKLNN